MNPETMKAQLKALAVAIVPPCWICETYDGTELPLTYEDYGNLNQNRPVHPCWAWLLHDMPRLLIPVSHLN